MKNKRENALGAKSERRQGKISVMVGQILQRVFTMGFCGAMSDSDDDDDISME